jgi:hypothetical protein
MQTVYRPRKADNDAEAVVRKNHAREIYGLRRGFACVLGFYGTYISRSVFVVPPEHIDDVNEVIREYKDKYARLPKQVLGEQANTCPNIEVLRFHPQEAGRIQEGARATLVAEMNKLLDEFDERIITAQDKGEVHTRTFQSFERKAGVVGKLAQVFEVAQEQAIAGLIEQLDVKLQLLGQYT